MDLTLQLDPATESKLRAQAALSGQDPQAFALAAITEKLSADGPPPVMLPHEEWHARFDAALAAMPRTAATFVDDSRESIYEGRGE